MGDDQVRCWDGNNKEITSEVDAWTTWDKVKKVKGFPGGLITFLQTNTDHEGCGYHKPTTVQAYAWPVLQSGQDLVGVAKTGSGKTLAFLLPGFVKLRKLKRNNEVDTSIGPVLLTMTPTRELCHQIFSDTEKFGKPVQISAAFAYGGANKRDQEYSFRQNPDCLIATPGRLNDFLDGGQVNVSQVRFAILDEADRMLDMGFEPQIRKIMDRVSTDRQTAMFTATWPKECKQLADNYIKNPTQIQIGSDGITTNKNVRQHIEVCRDDKAKMETVKRILQTLDDQGNCLIFSNTKRKCGDIAWEVGEDKSLGMPTTELHGDKSQDERDRALNDFRSGTARVMVATDVAARGLDVRNITTVINYDVPNNAEDYVHRIGRTGRADDMGDAYTIFGTWGDEKKAEWVMEIVEKAEQVVPQLLRDIADGKAQEGSAACDGSAEDSGGGGEKRGADDDWEESADKKGKW